MPNIKLDLNAPLQIKSPVEQGETLIKMGLMQESDLWKDCEIMHTGGDYILLEIESTPILMTHEVLGELRNTPASNPKPDNDVELPPEVAELRELFGAIFGMAPKTMQDELRAEGYSPEELDKTIAAKAEQATRPPEMPDDMPKEVAELLAALAGCGKNLH